MKKKNKYDFHNFFIVSNSAEGNWFGAAGICWENKYLPIHASNQLIKEQITMDLCIKSANKRTNKHGFMVIGMKMYEKTYAHRP